MCKNNIFSILITCLLCTSIYAQNYTVNYKIKVHKNRKELKGVSKFTQSTFDEMDSLEMKLFFDENKSIFKDEKLKKSYNSEAKIHNMARVLVVGITHTFYHDLSEKESYQIRNLHGNDYIIKSVYKPIKWELMDERKIIMGYKCRKAKTYRKRENRHGNLDNLEITAWYAPELPYSFGPKDFLGLPGLILELHEGKNRFSYIADGVLINPLGTIDFAFPQGEWISEEDFKKMY